MGDLCEPCSALLSARLLGPPVVTLLGGHEQCHADRLKGKGQGRSRMATLCQGWGSGDR